MHLRRDNFTLLLIDITMVYAAWLTYYFIRVQTGWFQLTLVPDIWLPATITTLSWILFFWAFGLYRPWYAKSRFDEAILVVKAIVVGVLILFFLIYYDDARTGEASVSRLLIFLYWFLMVVYVASGRIILRSLRRRMLEAGIGLRNTILVGAHSLARDFHSKLKKYPALGYRIVGFVAAQEDSSKDMKAGSEIFENGIPHLGGLESLEKVLVEKNVQEIILVLDSKEHELLLDIIGRCSAQEVGIKILPDLYDIVSGQARTSQIYGIPLIEITPQLMKPWEEAGKRVLDIFVSIFVLIVGFPLLLLIALVIKLDSRGPVFYRQQRVGKDGKIFRIFKFRSMVTDAESESGPTWAGKDDPRVTRIGRLLRKTHLDELPQFINVFDGDMSLVGPRPERPFFVDQFIKDIPLYRRRLNVQPGITGWAQVRFKYDESFEDVKTKLRYDLFYIENMSLRMDIIILLQTLSNVFGAKGHA